MNKMAARFDALSSRERLLISVTLGVLIVSLFFLLALEPLMKRHGRLVNQLSQMDIQLQSKQSERTAYNQAMNTDPSKPLREEKVRLEREEDQELSLIKQRSVNLVSPQEMAKLLEEVLAEGHPITLQKLSSLPVEVLDLTPERAEGEEETKTATQPSVYKHGFEMVMQGRYADIYVYLQHLESVSESFFWDSLEYNVDSYPDAEVRLQVHTLSSEEGWIGG